MNKMVCVLTLSLVISVSGFTQNRGPLDGLFNETSSIARVNNHQLMFWLYKLPSYMTFDDIVAELCEYLENRHVFGNRDIAKGWPIIWEDIKEWKPNPNLETSTL